MIGVVNLIVFPNSEDPKLRSLEIFNSFSEAKQRSEEIIEEFIEDYGEDWIEHATKEEPTAIMFNGEVTAYAYIIEVKNEKQDKSLRNRIKRISRNISFH